MGNHYYVYMLIDPRNGETFYVGKGMKRRMYQHRLDTLRQPTKVTPLFERIRSIHEAGCNVNYEKVVVNVSESVALIKEQEWIERLGRVDLNTGPLVNKTAGGNGSADLSPKELENKRDKSSKPITQYTLDGELVQHWPSAKTAGKQTTANRSYITQVCKGKRKSAGGFMWTYKGDPKPTMHKRYWKGVQQYSSDGYLMDKFQSLTEAQQETGVELHNISEACRGNSKTAGGFRWRYV